MMELNKEKHLSLLLGAGLGAGLMLALNPVRRVRKLGRAGDKTIKTLGKNRRMIPRRADSTGNPLSGVAAEIWSRRLPPPTDTELERRVRAELGQHIEHGWTIEVVADDGFVVLRGTVLPHQLEDAVSTARDVHGVRKVWSEMRLPNGAGDTPSLQS